MKKDVAVKIIKLLCTLALGWQIIYNGWFDIRFLDPTKIEYDSLHLADIAWFQNDFANIVVFLFCTLLIEYIVEKYQLTTKGFWINNLIEFAKVIIAIALASATISYWHYARSFIWQPETCRIYSHLLTTFTLFFNMVSAFLFISYDPITPIIKNCIPGKHNWKGPKARLISFIFVYLLLSLQIPFICDDIPFLLPVWLAADIIIWVRYIRYVKEKAKTHSNSPLPL